ncbi:MAG: hypothetical protein U0350_25285 [Caldilineaceae bacterium]
MNVERFTHVSSRAIRVFLVVVFALTVGKPAWAIEPRATATQPSVQTGALSPKQALDAIKAYIQGQHFVNETERIDFIRDWVNQNSIHLIDKDHDAYATNVSKVLTMLWQTYLTDQAPPHLSCGPRAVAMQVILNRLGIQSRLVYIFTDNYDQVQSHTFLEVFNRDTKSWEIQDPDFNIYYVDLRTQKRLATADLIWGDLDVLSPQSADAQGWEANNVAILKQDYFEAMMYPAQNKSQKSVILINNDRFDPKKSFPDNGNVTFNSFAKRAYRDPLMLVNQDQECAACKNLYKLDLSSWLMRYAGQMGRFKAE